MTDIPSHLSHEAQCIESCRAASTNYKYTNFDQTNKTCTCINKDNMDPLPDPAAQLPAVTQQDCSNFRYVVRICLTYLTDPVKARGCSRNTFIPNELLGD